MESLIVLPCWTQIFVGKLRLTTDKLREFSKCLEIAIRVEETFFLIVHEQILVEDFSNSFGEQHTMTPVESTSDVVVNT